MDGNGKRVKRLTIRGAWSQIVEELEHLPGKVAVCYEASTGYGYLNELLSQEADRVVVAHSSALQLIFRIQQGNREHKKIALIALTFVSKRNLLSCVGVPERRSKRQFAKYPMIYG